jgi:hypothetical protein
MMNEEEAIDNAKLTYFLKELESEAAFMSPHKDKNLIEHIEREQLSGVTYYSLVTECCFEVASPQKFLPSLLQFILDKAELDNFALWVIKNDRNDIVGQFQQSLYFLLNQLFTLNIPCFYFLSDYTQLSFQSKMPLPILCYVYENCNFLCILSGVSKIFLDRLSSLHVSFSRLFNNISGSSDRLSASTVSMKATIKERRKGATILVQGKQNLKIVCFCLLESINNQIDFLISSNNCLRLYSESYFPGASRDLITPDFNRSSATENEGCTAAVKLSGIFTFTGIFQLVKRVKEVLSSRMNEVSSSNLSGYEFLRPKSKAYDLQLTLSAATKLSRYSSHANSLMKSGLKTPFLSTSLKQSLTTVKAKVNSDDENQLFLSTMLQYMSSTILFNAVSINSAREQLVLPTKISFPNDNFTDAGRGSYFVGNSSIILQKEIIPFQIKNSQFEENQMANGELDVYD